MNILKIVAVVLLLAVVVLAVVAPVGPMPGVRIGGTEAQPPAQWEDTSGVHEIKLKVPGTLPRVVIIWVVDLAGELYVVGAADSGWVTMIGSGSPVEMRLGDNTYGLTAEPVGSGWEPILAAYVAKYRPDYPEIVGGFPSIEEAEGQMAVFHLKRG